MRHFLWPLLFILNATAEPGAPAYRDFTSQSGRTVRARLLRVDGATAHLRRTGSEDMAIPISALSPEDQAYLQDWNPDERRIAWLESLSVSDFLGQAGFVSVPLRLEPEGITIETSVNGTPVPFAFDPGRFLSLLDRERSRAVGGKTTEVVFADFTLADGSVESVHATVFDSFDLGAAHLTDWEMGVVSFPRVQLQGEGILGSDALELLDALVDWGKKRIHLRPSGGSTSPAPPEDTPPHLRPELREYITASGQTLLGELARWSGDEITLNVDGGKQVVIPRKTLSTADQEYIDLWTTHPARQPPAKEDDATAILQAKGYRAAPYSYGDSTVAGFEMTLGTESVRFLLNTTLPVSYLDVRKAKQAGLTPIPGNEVIRIERRQVPVPRAEVTNLAVGGETLPPFEFRVLDLESAGAAGAVPIKTCMIFRFPEVAKRRAGRIQVDGILGRDWLLRIRPVIDFSSQKMMIRP